MIQSSALRTFTFFLCFGASLMLVSHDAHASALAATTLASGLNQTRTTIPVIIEGQRASCVLDTGSSAILVSPSLAAAARMAGREGTFELAPDGHTYVDRQTEIAHFSVAGHYLHNVPALISSNLSGSTALCGYDFFAHFPTLIERDRRLVTLFPTSSQLARMHCLTVDLSPHVPLATVEINGSWLSHIVLDSGMAGGGALWDGVRQELRQPLVSTASYGVPPTIQNGFACGAAASIRYATGTPASVMPICTEPQRPDGYNGIIETNLPTVHAMAVDYPHRRICFSVTGYSQVTASSNGPTINRNGAWSRFNYLRPPQ